MKKTKVNVNAKDRIQILLETRKELGNNLTLKKTPKGYMLSNKGDFANKAL